MQVERLDSGGVRIVLPPAADGPQTQALKDALGEAFEEGIGITIDASGVQRISTPAIQVLVAAAFEAERRRIPVPTYAGMSTAFTEAAALVAADTALGLSGD